MNYKQSNWLTDEVMPNTTGNEFKIVAAVARQSLGWQCGGVVLSLSDLQHLTGMSRPSVISNTEKAVKSGHIAQEPHGQGFVYRCVASKEILLVKHPDQLRIFTTDSKETLPEGLNSFTSSGKETLPLTSGPKEEKEVFKEREKEGRPAPIIDYDMNDALASNGMSIHDREQVAFFVELFKSKCIPVSYKNQLESAIKAIKHKVTPQEAVGISNGYWSRSGYGKGPRPYPSQVADHVETYREWVSNGKPKAGKPKAGQRNEPEVNVVDEFIVLGGD